jgi:hypothetical protein
MTGRTKKDTRSRWWRGRRKKIQEAGGGTAGAQKLTGEIVSR